MTAVTKELIRIGIATISENDTVEVVEGLPELNALYANKIKRALADIDRTSQSDIDGFVELMQAVFIYAKINGIENTTLIKAMQMKAHMFGEYGNLVKVSPNNF